MERLQRFLNMFIIYGSIYGQTGECSSISTITNPFTVFCYETPSYMSPIFRKENCSTCSELLIALSRSEATISTYAYCIKESHLCTRTGYSFEENSHLCYKVYQDAFPQRVAQITCNGEGGQLFQIDSAAKQGAIKSFGLNRSENYWIDGTSRDNDWCFASGATISEFYWGDDEADTSDERNCLTVNPDHDNLWQKADCGNSKKYICERKI